MLFEDCETHSLERACPDVQLLWVADAQGCKPATTEERHFLKATGALLRSTGKAWLISEALAVYACGKAGVGAPLLAAMAEIAKLQPYSAPLLPQAQPAPALTHGVDACYLNLRFYC